MSVGGPLAKLPAPVPAEVGAQPEDVHADDQHAGSKVFVGGLAITVTSDELAQHFSGYGTITDAVAMRQRGFGFVEFVEPEAAQAVIDAGPHLLHGKEVSVKLAESRESMAQAKTEAATAGLPTVGPPSLPNKIFVGGLPRHTDTSQLSNYFSAYGVISDAVVMPSRGFGFVAFQDREAMEAVMAEAELHAVDGQPITVKVADGHRPSRSLPPPRLPPNGDTYGPPPLACGKVGPCHGVSKGGPGGPRHGVRKVFVGGVPRDLATKELQDYFSWYGRLLDCVVMAGRGFGFVEFDDEAAVGRVMQDAGNHVIRDARVSLRLADGKGKGAGPVPTNSTAGHPHVRWGPPPAAGWGPAPAAMWGPPPPQPSWGHGPAPSKGCSWGPSKGPLPGKGPPPGKGVHWGPPPAAGPGYWAAAPPRQPVADGYGPAPAAAGTGGAKIFVRGLPENIGDEGLREYFSFYGPINDSKVMVGRGFGFVTFADAQCIAGALQERHEIDGHRLSVKLADGLKGPSKGAAPY